MRTIICRLLRNQRAFTLVEILIAVAILGIVAAVAVPTVANILSRSKVKAYEGELSNVQAATDAMMGDLGKENGLEILPINATLDMKVFPGGGDPLYGGVTGDFMRQELTKCTYSVTDNGRVSPEVCPQ